MNADLIVELNVTVDSESVEVEARGKPYLGLQVFPVKDHQQPAGTKLVLFAKVVALGLIEQCRTILGSEKSPELPHRRNPDSPHGRLFALLTVTDPLAV